ncbi:hypothetical protein LR48_Vigan03g077700 [Vigna angularis]|uniref:Uncharacterized protein n=1 Tax=Phaseolus angularis TaxID=3914 RepID=A0A0L9U3M8_PHAAN|nr:hypothetical protein LR48_Vigan03g077700 [Vigna angularis]
MAYPNSYYPPQPTTYAPPAMPTTVIGPQFCAPYPVDLTMVKKVMTIADGNFVVTDVNGNLVFKVKGSIMSLHDRCVLLDAAGHPLVILRRKGGQSTGKVLDSADRVEAELIYPIGRLSLIRPIDSLRSQPICVENERKEIENEREEGENER